MSVNISNRFLGSLIQARHEYLFHFTSVHAKGIRILLFFSSIMGEELVWACKNGDLDQVKAIVEKPVRKLFCGSALEEIFHFICGCVKCCFIDMFFRTTCFEFGVFLKIQ